MCACVQSYSPTLQLGLEENPYVPQVSCLLGGAGKHQLHDSTRIQEAQ